MVYDTLFSEIVEVPNNKGSERANIPLKLNVLLVFATTYFMRRLLWLASSLCCDTLMLPLKRDEEQVENFLGRERAAEAILDLTCEE